MAFTANPVPMQACLDAIAKLKTEAGIDDKKIYTSKDFPGIWSSKVAACSNVPAGVKKVILPVSLGGTVTSYMSTIAANTKVPEHSHTDGPGMRLILSGSISFKGKELTETDWLYLPAGVRYEYEVGPRGVVILGWYECCCR
jgi:hypothetical protein